jgi:hypothetical protein
MTVKLIMPNCETPVNLGPVGKLLHDRTPGQHVIQLAFAARPGLGISAA